VHALTEAEVPAPGPGDVEGVGVGELALVAVGGTGHQHDPAAGGDRDAVQGDLPRGGAGGELQRRDEAQGLLDGGGDERGVGLQQRPLVGVLGEQLEERAGQSGGGLHPAEEEDHHQAADLRGRRHLRVHERHAVDVGLHEPGDQVVACGPAALLQQVDEVLLDAGGGRPRHRGQVRGAGHPVLQLVGPVLQLLALGQLDRVLLVPAGQAHEVEEHVEGHRPGQLLGQVHRPAVPPGGDEVAHHRADAVLQLGDPAREEVGLHHRADLVVAGVVHAPDGPGGHLLQAAVVDVHALEAEEGVRVERRGPDVVEAGQDPPTPLLVEVDRGLVAHPPVRRERVAHVEVGRERVVVDRARGHRGLRAGAGR
jgi:hypothetical protein